MKNFMKKAFALLMVFAVSIPSMVVTSFAATPDDNLGKVISIQEVTMEDGSEWIETIYEKDEGSFYATNASGNKTFTNRYEAKNDSTKYAQLTATFHYDTSTYIAGRTH